MFTIVCSTPEIPVPQGGTSVISSRLLPQCGNISVYCNNTQCMDTNRVTLFQQYCNNIVGWLLQPLLAAVLLRCRRS